MSNKTFSSPACKTEFAYSRDIAGQKCQCSECGEKFIVPVKKKKTSSSKKVNNKPPVKGSGNSLQFILILLIVVIGGFIAFTQLTKKKDTKRQPMSIEKSSPQKNNETPASPQVDLKSVLTEDLLEDMTQKVLNQ